jgi:hypothetical protein
MTILVSIIRHWLFIAMKYDFYKRNITIEKKKQVTMAIICNEPLVPKELLVQK